MWIKQIMTVRENVFKLINVIEYVFTDWVFLWLQKFAN